jgi:hypothetical protein
MAIGRNKKASFVVLDDSYAPRKEGNRRLGIERRFFRYDVHIPERRSQAERRRGRDRRLIINLAIGYP